MSVASIDGVELRSSDEKLVTCLGETFISDEARRDHWKRLFADEAFMAFARQLRPLLKSQSNQLMLAAPWGSPP